MQHSKTLDEMVPITISSHSLKFNNKIFTLKPDMTCPNCGKKGLWKNDQNEICNCLKCCFLVEIKGLYKKQWLGDQETTVINCLKQHERKLQEPEKIPVVDAIESLELE